MDITTQLPANQFSEPALINSEAVQQVPPSRVFGVLYRRKWLILAIATCLSVPAVAEILLIKPYYDATTLLTIDSGKSTFRDLQATISTPDADLVAIATQVGIIRSPALAIAVVDKLDLTNQADFAQILDAPPTIVGKVQQRLMKLLGQVQPEHVMTNADRRQIAAQHLADMINVTNDGKSYIISIRARTFVPALSAELANAYVEAYLQFKQQQKVAAIHRSSALLDDQIAPLADRVNKADEAVEQYRAEHGLLLNRPEGEGQNTGGTTVASQQLAQINNQLIAAQTDLAQKQANLGQIEAAQRSGHLDAVPEVVASPLIASLRAQQAELSGKAASLGDYQASNNPVLRAAQAADSELRQRITAETNKIAASVRNQANAAQAQVAVLQASLARVQQQVGGQSQANVRLRQLETEAHAAQSIYQDYLNRFELTLNQSTLQEAEANQISAAEVPIGKSGPARGLFLLLAEFIIVGLACFVALILDRLRQGIRTVDQLETQVGLFGLGFVPMAPSKLRRIFLSPRPTIYKESIHVISNLLRFGQEKLRARVVLVTSAVPQEGKTFFAISLAATVGCEGGKALLIDCDMRRPSVAKILGLKNDPSESGTTAILRRAVWPGLDVVSFRPVPAGERSVVSSSQIQKLLDEARQHYDIIVLDTPPVIPFAETPILSLNADGAIMVVRWRHTPASVINSAVKILGSYRIRVLGGVVTQVKPNQVAKSDGGHAYTFRSYASYFR
jgi:succinoglycan biosynthesis transport protein ExoP